jgi:hypothetical protein
VIPRAQGVGRDPGCLFSAAAVGEKVTKAENGACWAEATRPLRTELERRWAAERGPLALNPANTDADSDADAGAGAGAGVVADAAAADTNAEARALAREEAAQLRRRQRAAAVRRAQGVTPHEPPTVASSVPLAGRGLGGAARTQTALHLAREDAQVRAADPRLAELEDFFARHFFVGPRLRHQYGAALLEWAMTTPPPGRTVLLLIRRGDANCPGGGTMCDACVTRMRDAAAASAVASAAGSDTGDGASSDGGARRRRATAAQPGDLIGSIAGSLSRVKIQGRVFAAAETSFLCLHTEFRDLGLAPRLVAEVRFLTTPCFTLHS